MSPNFSSSVSSRFTSRPLTPPIFNSIESTTKLEESITKLPQSKSRKIGKKYTKTPRTSTKILEEEQPEEPKAKIIRRRSCCCQWCGGISDFEAKNQDIVNDLERLGRLSSPGDSSPNNKLRGAARIISIAQTFGKPNLDGKNLQKGKIGSSSGIDRKGPKILTIVPAGLSKSRGASLTLEQDPQAQAGEKQTETKLKETKEETESKSILIDQGTINEVLNGKSKPQNSPKMNQTLRRSPTDSMLNRKKSISGSTKPKRKSQLPVINTNTNDYPNLLPKSREGSPMVKSFIVQKTPTPKDVKGYSNVKVIQNLLKSDSAKLKVQANRVSGLLLTPRTVKASERLNEDFFSQNELFPGKISLTNISLVPSKDMIKEERNSCKTPSSLFHQITMKVKERKEHKKVEKIEKSEKSLSELFGKHKERYVKIYSEDTILKNIQRKSPNKKGFVGSLVKSRSAANLMNNKSRIFFGEKGGTPVNVVRGEYIEESKKQRNLRVKVSEEKINILRLTFQSQKSLGKSHSPSRSKGRMVATPA